MALWALPFLPWKRTSSPGSHPFLVILILLHIPISNFSCSPPLLCQAHRYSWFQQCWPWLFLPSSSKEIVDFLLVISLLPSSAPKLVFSAMSPVLSCTLIFLTAGWPVSSGQVNKPFTLILFVKVHHLASQSYFPPSIFILLKDTFIPQAVQGRSSLLFPFVQISGGTKCYQIYFLTFNSNTLSLSIQVN